LYLTEMIGDRRREPCAQGATAFGMALALDNGRQGGTKKKSRSQKIQTKKFHWRKLEYEHRKEIADQQHDGHQEGPHRQQHRSRCQPAGFQQDGFEANVQQDGLEANVQQDGLEANVQQDGLEANVQQDGLEAVPVALDRFLHTRSSRQAGRGKRRAVKISDKKSPEEKNNNMSIEKKSLISSKKTTKKANAGSNTTTGSPLVSNRMASKAGVDLGKKSASKWTLDVKRASKK
jgi:hypothetical protein